MARVISTVLVITICVCIIMIGLLRHVSRIWKQMFPLHLLNVHGEHTFTFIGIRSLKHDIQHILHRYRQAKVFIVEPNPGEYKSTFANNVGQVYVIAKAIVPETQSATTQFFIHHKKGSVCPPKQLCKSTTILNVQPVTLTALLKQTRGCTVLYINVGGMEYDILRTWLSHKINRRHRPEHVIVDRSEMYGSFDLIAKFNTIKALFERQDYYIEYDLTTSMSNRVVFPRRKYVMFTYDKNKLHV